MARKQDKRGVVQVQALSMAGEVVVDVSIPVDVYYAESHPLIDDDSYRKARGIRKIIGTVFNYDGELDQRFENEYEPDGAYRRSRTTHSDGTVHED